MDEKQHIAEAADRVMILDLLGRYAFAADYGTGNPSEWASLFVEDGRFEAPESGLQVTGHAALCEFIDGLHRTIPGLHHVMSNHVIDIDGDRAYGKCQLNEFLLRPEAIYPCIHGWYEDTYVRIDNRWYFELRKVYALPDNATVSTNGRIGEYFKEYWKFCEGYYTN